MLLLRVAWRVCTLMHLISISCRYRLRGAKFFCVRRGNQRLSWMRAASFCHTLRNRPQAECACHGSHPLSPHCIPLVFHRFSGELALVAVCTGSFTWYMRRIVLAQTCDTIHCCKMMWDCLSFLSLNSILRCLESGAQCFKNNTLFDCTLCIYMVRTLSKVLPRSHTLFRSP